MRPMPKITIAVKTLDAMPAAPIAAGPSELTMMVSTMPIAIQPISARMTGAASVRSGRISPRIDDIIAGVDRH